MDTYSFNPKLLNNYPSLIMKAEDLKYYLKPNFYYSSVKIILSSVKLDGLTLIISPTL